MQSMCIVERRSETLLVHLMPSAPYALHSAKVQVLLHCAKQRGTHNVHLYTVSVYVFYPRSFFAYTVYGPSVLLDTERAPYMQKRRSKALLVHV